MTPVDGLEVPIYVTRNFGEMKIIAQNLRIFAERGVVLHINSKYYKELREKTSRQTAKTTIKPLTAHNDKLGFDWSVVSTRFIAKPSSQFKVSAYKEFLK